MLATASSHYDRQARLIVVGLAATRRAWRSNTTPALAATLATLQIRAAREADQAIAANVAEQSLAAPEIARLNPGAFTTASDGRPLGSLLTQAATYSALQTMVATQIADTGRAASSVAIASRPALTGYIRNVGATCCSRCAILAGRFYPRSSGFLRHSNCKCTMVATTRGGFGEVIETPDDLFRAGRITDLSKDDARAIEMGADMSRVVNVRRTASGLKVAGKVQVRGGKLTPAGIFNLASDNDDALRMLAKAGYIR